MGVLRLAVVLATLFAAACSSPPPVNRDASVPLATVKEVDLERYAGLWYEVARFPNSFEKDCVAATAQYIPNKDGTIKVLNRCRKLKFDGAQDVVEGKARVIGKGKLGVTFFWPFEGDYWILDLADDYTWALIGEPKGRYLWILSRKPHLEPELKASLEAKLKAFGYNTSALYWTPQP
jgi:apolipoprotein D and lipocalin family protein